MPEDIAEAQLRVGPLGTRFPGVERIGVLRGGGLGDLLFGLPAVKSLADAYPAADIVLFGSPLHDDLLTGRPGPISSVWTLPAARGVHEPTGAPPDALAQERFFRRARERSFDLVVQLHGGGRWSNPFVRKLGARWSVGSRTPDAVPLDRWLPFRYYQHEVLRALEVVGLAGAPVSALQPTLAVTNRDLDEADSALDGLPTPLLAVHPGATDFRRHWPAERFAEVVASVVASGAGAVVLGTSEETELAKGVVERARARLAPGSRGAVRSLAGALGLAGMVGVLARASVLVGNDSGPRHVAQAVGTPTVAVYWMANVVNAGPFGRATHRVHISWTPNCPVCGVDCVHLDVPRCEHDVSFVADVPMEDVRADVVDLMATTTAPADQDRQHRAVPG